MSRSSKETRLISGYYDRSAGSYEDTWRMVLWRVCDRLTWQLLKPILPRDGIILDAAGGTGRWARRIAAGKRSVLVFDISKRMLIEGRRLAKKGRVLRKLDFVLGSVESLPFRSRAFRFLLCQHAFFTFQSTEKPLSEFMRTLARRGKFLISVQSKYGISLLRLQAISGRGKKTKTHHGLSKAENFVEPHEVERAISGSGGRVDRVLGMAFSALSGNSKLYSRKFDRPLFIESLRLESNLSRVPEFAWIAPHTQTMGTKVR